MEYHEIADIFPMMAREEYQSFKSSIELNGLMVPIILFENKILDGRNRHKACQELGIEPKYEQFEGTFLDAVNFVWVHNIDRRHLDSNQKAACVAEKEALVERYETEAKERQREGIKEFAKKRERNDDGTFSQNSQKIDSSGDPNTGRSAQKLAELAGTNRQYVSDAIKIRKENPDLFKEIKEGKKRIPQVRKQIKKEKFKKEVENTKTPELLNQKYRTIIMDPPWPSDKFIRECRPNQDTLDYNQMSLTEIGLIKVSEISYDDSFIFLWTTQKFLPLSFDLIIQWGFKYFFTMVWHKSGGPQPYEMPQFNCEFVVCGKKGNIQFLDFKNFFTCFDGKRREHSRKPDEFYELIKRVTPEPRIDFFSREKRDGFDQYGNETAKFQNGQTESR